MKLFKIRISWSDKRYGCKLDNPLLGFPFAKLLRNFCGTKCKICLSLHMSLSRKNNNLRYHSQKSFCAKLPYSVFAKLKFCAILQLEFCAILKFCKNQTVGDGVCFLEFNSSSVGRFCTKIRNRLSSKSWLLSCIILYEIKKISVIWFKKFKNIIHTWLGKAFKGHLKLFNRIKVLPSFTLTNFYFINFGPFL